MSILDHGPADDAEPQIDVRASRPGLVLFGLYLLIYGVFVALNAFWPGLMEASSIAGVSLAVAYGLALIVLAFALALIYAWICRSRAASGKPGP